jgi:hypothetical protein
MGCLASFAAFPTLRTRHSLGASNTQNPAILLSVACQLNESRGSNAFIKLTPESARSLSCSPVLYKITAANLSMIVSSDSYFYDMGTCSQHLNLDTGMLLQATSLRSRTEELRYP